MKNDLDDRKKDLGLLLEAQKPIVNKNKFIQEQRGNISSMQEQLVTHRQYKDDLRRRLNAIKAVKANLDQKDGRTDAKIEDLIRNMKVKKAKMESNQDIKRTVQLQKRAFDIDFDAY